MSVADEFKLKTPCPMCSHDRGSTKYLSQFDKLRFTCHRCKHSWSLSPQRHDEVVKEQQRNTDVPSLEERIAKLESQVSWLSNELSKFLPTQ